MDVALDRLKVLVVDDNLHMIGIVKTILRSFGIKDYVEANKVSMAMSFAEVMPVDIVICDYVMPEMNGCELVRLLRSKPGPNRMVPVIMLTAHTARAMVEEARDSGVNEVCVKPITPAELYRKVCAVVNNPRPFVRTETYFGPTRRRHTNPKPYKGPERREENPDDGSGTR
jgi:CheY-like chemotaxis protein